MILPFVWISSSPFVREEKQKEADRVDLFLWNASSI